VGFRYEVRGYTVMYQGIIEGLSDLGRDLIAKKGDEVEIVQWSKHRTIHERHVFQLFGTTVGYWLKNGPGTDSNQLGLLGTVLTRGTIKPTFYTSTVLSDAARGFAAALGVHTVENEPLAEYPCIKCNVARKTGEKIYHLPFDQQYDNVVIEPPRGECYVTTVKEAEELGFRRAFRWRGEEPG